MPPGVDDLLLALMAVATANCRGSTDYLDGLGCTAGGFYRGIGKFAEILPDRVNDANDNAGAVFAIAYACGEADALRRARAAISSPVVAGHTVEFLAMLESGESIDRALARLAARRKASASVEGGTNVVTLQRERE